jgi:hypothetical protein
MGIRIVHTLSQVALPILHTFRVIVLVFQMQNGQYQFGFMQMILELVKFLEEDFLGMEGKLVGNLGFNILVLRRVLIHTKSKGTAIMKMSTSIMDLFIPMDNGIIG